MDFTHNTYTQLVHALKEHCYPFYPFASRVSLIINTHPEHWARKGSEWMRIKAVRTVRNGAKRVFFRKR
ncbi:MAG: hypothetical protein K9L57_00320 [Spirochaetaceae bacterium]|nr:hypothetical protein [Spirochaetaceae bacterium]